METHADKSKILSNLNFKNYYESELSSIKWNGKEGIALCPFHDDQNPSLSVNPDTGLVNCFGCGFSGDVITFHGKKYDLSFQDVLIDLAKIAGLNKPREKKIVETYDYLDESGKLLFQAVRYEPKDFRQRRPDGKGGWTWNLKDITTIPYNLPEVKKAQNVYIVEGEKDVETLRKIGFVGTTNPQGAGKWKEHFNPSLAGKDVVILPDNDEPGKAHAESVANSISGIANSIKIVNLPDLPDKGDITDFLKNHSKEDILKIIANTSEWEKSQQRKTLSKLTRFSDLKNEEIQVVYVIDGIFPKQTVTTLTAKGGLGKTYFVMGCAKAIETGTDFLGLKTEKLPCYYIDFENPRPVMKDRAIELGLEDSYFWHMGDKEPPPRLDSKEYTEYMNLQPGIIFIDSLRACQSGDENSSKDMAEIMKRAKELRDYGHTVVFLHHTTKASERQFRGSLAIFDQADHVLNFYPVRDLESGKAIEVDDTDDLDSLTFYLGTKEKTRYKPFHIYIKRAGNGAFVIADDPKTENIRAIQGLLKEKGPMNQTALTKSIKDELSIKGDKKIRRLLKEGIGNYWTTDKGDKNSVVFQSVSFTTYSSSKNCQTETNRFSNIHSTSEANSAKPIDNMKLFSNSGGVCQTAKQDLNDDFIPEISEDL